MLYYRMTYVEDDVGAGRACISLWKAFRQGSQVPQVPQLVFAGAGKCSAIGRECQGIDDTLVRLQRSPRMAGTDVPDRDIALAAAGGEQDSVQGERQAGKDVVVPGEGGELLERRN